MATTTAGGVTAPPVELLRLYHDRLREIDESVRDLTNFFFTLNSLLIGLYIQFANDDKERLVLAVLGYGVAVAIQCITYKGYLSWRVLLADMRPLEQETGYDYVQMNYDRRMDATVGKDLRVTLIRMRFGFAFIVFWTAAISAIFYGLPSFFGSLAPGAAGTLDIMLYLIIILLPWVMYAGRSALRAAVAITKSTWGKEV